MPTIKSCNQLDLFFLQCEGGAALKGCQSNPSSNVSVMTRLDDSLVLPTVSCVTPFALDVTRGCASIKSGI
jgi:hypothetical protein